MSIGQPTEPPLFAGLPPESREGDASPAVPGKSDRDRDAVSRVRAASEDLIEVLAGTAGEAVRRAAHRVPGILAAFTADLHRGVAALGRSAGRRPLATAGLALGAAALAAWLVRRD